MVIVTSCALVVVSPSESVIFTLKFAVCGVLISRFVLATNDHVPSAFTVSVPLPVSIASPTLYSVPLNTTFSSPAPSAL